ncbi:MULTISPECIES: hypothetical protein [unclassified Streptomyces]|uniref:hypothetical protein n=1 Tax=unclassified Streptomyces TaxID=2593676 RepID=UPI0033A4E5DE
MARRFATPIPCELTTTDTGMLARFAEPVRIDHLELRENLAAGQHIAHHELLVDGRVIAQGRTVGIRRFHAFEPVTVREIQIRLTGGNQALAAVNGFRCGHSTTTAPPTHGQAASASAKPN